MKVSSGQGRLAKKMEWQNSLKFKSRYGKIGQMSSTDSKQLASCHRCSISFETTPEEVLPTQYRLKRTIQRVGYGFFHLTKFYCRQSQNLESRFTHYISGKNF